MEGEVATTTASDGMTPLQSLQQQESSLLGLVRVLLRGKTLPHLVMILLLSSGLHLLAMNGQRAFSALVFLSLSCGYLFTGLLSGFNTVRRWTELPDANESVENGRGKRLLLSFRICLFPLALSLLFCGILIGLIGGQGALGDRMGLLPPLLSSCFVIWAVVQGRSFGRWLASVAASRLPLEEERETGGLRRSETLSFVVVFLLATTLLLVFEALAGTDMSLGSIVVGNIGFFAVVIGLFLIAYRLAREARLQASARADFRAFASRWMLLSQLLITWHFLTVWRHFSIDQNGGFIIVEELVLMAFTIVMAIWGLTSRTYRSSLNLVNTENALPIGLAFGYAYAGSVAMLASLLDDIKNVMMAGHLVVMMTFLWMQPRVLAGTIGGLQHAENIRRIVDDAVSSESELEAEVEESGTGTASETVEEATPSVADTEEVEAIGEDVAWSEPEVLASEVDWDDEVELVD